MSQAHKLARIHAPELRAEGLKQARIYGVSPGCAQVYGEGWAAGYGLALEELAELKRQRDEVLGLTTSFDSLDRLVVDMESIRDIYGEASPVEKGIEER